MHPDPIDIELLDRYLAGAATPDENAIVEAWVAKRPQNAWLFDAFRRELGLAAEAPPASDANAVWARISDRLASEAGTAAPSGQPIQLKLHRPRISGPRSPFRDGSSTRARWLISGGIAIAAAASLLLFVNIDREPTQPATPPSPREYASSRGQRAELRLTDGTRVVLAPDSRLIVPATFDSLDRTVTLEGQGYFDVVHNDAKPFSVRAGRAFIRDLGTRFDVRAFATESSVRVVVTQGKVQLGRSMAPIDSAPLLVAGSLGRVRDKGATTVTTGVDTTRFVSWTRGVLVFDRTPVPEALAELARWYDIDVRLADTSIAGLTLTATLKDQSLTEVLDVVALSLGATVQRQGRDVTLTARRELP